MNESPKTFLRNSSGLVRDLSAFDVFVWAISSPAASGILYFSVATPYMYPGANMSLGFLIGLVVFAPVAVLLGLVTAGMPRSGGMYVIISRVLDPSLGFLASWLFFVSYGLTCGVLGYIVTGILGSIISMVGEQVSSSPTLSFGAVMQTKWGQTGGALIWLIVFWIISLQGIKSVRNTMRILFLVPLLATLIAMGFFLAHEPATSLISFDTVWGKGAFDKILTTARDHGWTSGSFSLLATLNALLVVLWAYAGLETVNYVAGEVKTPRSSLFKGFVLGILGLGLLYSLLAYSVEKAFGGFIDAYAFLFANHKEALLQIMPAQKPSVPFYALSLIGFSSLGIVVAISICFWFVNTIPPLLSANSRLLFAFAMDRALPPALANVHPRRGTPVNSINLSFAVAILGVVLMSQDVGAILGTLDMTMLFILWPFGLACAVLPFFRKDLYEQMPYRKTILGLPVISILGVIVFIEGWCFLFLSVMHFNLQIIGAMAGVLLVGMALYVWQQKRNVEQNILTASIYQHLPPE